MTKDFLEDMTEEVQSLLLTSDLALKEIKNDQSPRYKIVKKFLESIKSISEEYLVEEARL